MRGANDRAIVHTAGDHEAVIGGALPGLHALFDIVFDGFGGSMTGAALTRLAKNRICIICGGITSAKTRSSREAELSETVRGA